MSTISEALGMARNGFHVGWFGINYLQAALVLADAPTDATRVRRANGAGRIEFASGGVLTVHSVVGHGFRGEAFDAAYLPHWRYVVDDDFMGSLLPCFATTGDPRIGVVV